MGIRGKMKINSELTCLKLRRFLEKKILDTANRTKDIAEEWVNPKSNKLEIRVTLRLAGGELEDGDVIERVVGLNAGPVTYSVN